jgi:hypothetical protein
MGTSGSFPSAKRPWREVDNSPPTITVHEGVIPLHVWQGQLYFYASFIHVLLFIDSVVDTVSLKACEQKIPKAGSTVGACGLRATPVNQYQSPDWRRLCSSCSWLMLQTSRLEVYIIYGGVCLDRHFELSKCYCVYSLKKNYIIKYKNVMKINFCYYYCEVNFITF